MEIALVAEGPHQSNPIPLEVLRDFPFFKKKMCVGEGEVGSKAYHDEAALLPETMCGIMDPNNRHSAARQRHAVVVRLLLAGCAERNPSRTSRGARCSPDADGQV